MTEQMIEEPKIQYIKALVKAQSKMKPVQKTGKNPYFKSKYAPYEEVWESVGKPLNENGIAVSHKTLFEGDKFCLVTRLQHVGGYEESSIHIIQADKNDTMQSKGSAETYAKRYNLVALTGVPIVDEDDDGEEDRKQKIKEQPVMVAPNLDFNNEKLTFQEIEEIEDLLGDDDGLRLNMISGYRKQYPEANIVTLGDIPRKAFVPIVNNLTNRKRAKA